METKIETKPKIRNYIIETTLAETENIEDDTLIFESGLLDSMGFLFLIEFLKDEFGVVTNDDELIVENFESINTISEFLDQKL
jgi:acyl carrier protein